MAPSPDEAVVEAVLEAVPGVEVMTVVEVLGAERGRPVAGRGGRFLATAPHKQGTDGFFAAVLRRPRRPREESAVGEEDAATPAGVSEAPEGGVADAPVEGRD